MLDTPQKLVETVREALRQGANYLDPDPAIKTYHTCESLRAEFITCLSLLSSLSSTLGSKDAPWNERDTEALEVIAALKTENARLESALGEKTVPLAMLYEIGEYGFSEVVESGMHDDDLRVIVSRHMPDFRVE